MKKYLYLLFAVMTTISSMPLLSCADDDDEIGGFGGRPPKNVEAINLDLPSGTLWANMNVGATSPEDYGGYFAWGETKTKDNYTSETYTYTDNPSQLPASADAATANWGNNWCMPSSAQFSELINNCYTEWTTQNGVTGCRFTSKTNGNSIFLPAARYRGGTSLNLGGLNGYYWSRKLYPYYSYYAWFLDFDSSEIDTYCRNRYFGRSIRPVRSSE